MAVPIGGGNAMTLANVPGSSFMALDSTFVYFEDDNGTTGYVEKVAKP
jgi:hypothetical protein